MVTLVVICQFRAALAPLRVAPCVWLPGLALVAQVAPCLCLVVTARTPRVQVAASQWQLAALSAMVAASRCLLVTRLEHPVAAREVACPSQLVPRHPRQVVHSHCRLVLVLLAAAMSAW